MANKENTLLFAGLMFEIWDASCLISIPIFEPEKRKKETKNVWSFQVISLR